MITVTRLDHARFAVNPDLIERVHAAPDTTLHMVDGHVYVIEETLDQLTDLIVGYRARVLATAQALVGRPEV
ncbi:flagellar FlbD family protein [Microbacterium sp.]|jgi:flagellar protein FlbD|uniref:flagellar FlbD family protein n=1 Tax=Microbacterium sp. TaxID=51671 RepID=UPI002BF008A2|nr:flagellar FlbD family protein [Microbacterium sp.]HET6301255.1 flagellar FlbD family protein [Microbacterium sp.]HWL76850.1 flagellar FlbD family protein [Microbacterium sp.]